jgi:PAS domain S-box-containing protein
MKKILVVDNDQLFLTFMTDLLSKKGYKVLTALDGLSALELLKTYAADIIFVDLIMPRIDGRKLCGIIRGMEAFQMVPIIILSATLAEEQMNMRDLGADAFIAKGPFEEMAAHITDVLSSIECADSTQQNGVLGIKSVFPRGITRELLSVNRYFRNILDRMDEGVLEITRERQIVFANRAALSMLGLSEKDLLGTILLTHFDDEQRPHIEALIRAPGDESRSIPHTSPLRYADAWLSIRSLPTLDDHQTQLILMNDVTCIHREKEFTAHAIKRSATTILGCIEQVECDQLASDELKRRIASLKIEGKRMKEIAKRLS